MPFAGETTQGSFKPSYGNYTAQAEVGGTYRPWMSTVSKTIPSAASFQPQLRDPIGRMRGKLRAAQSEMDRMHSGFRTIDAQAKQSLAQLRKYREWTVKLSDIEAKRQTETILNMGYQSYTKETLSSGLYSKGFRYVNPNPYMFIRRPKFAQVGVAMEQWKRGWDIKFGNFRYVSGQMVRGQQIWFLANKGRTIAARLGNVSRAARVIGRVSIWWTVIDLISAFFRNVARLARPLEKVSKNIAKAKATKRVAQRYVLNSFRNKNFEVDSLKASVTVDTRNFEEAMRRYVQNSRKDFKDIVNQKCYWVAINSIKMTYKVDKNKIQTDLSAPARENPDFTLAEFLVMKDAKWNSVKMTRAQVRAKAKKLINTRKRAVGFLRSGWIPAIKALAPIVEKRVGAALEREKGRPKGGGRPALTSTSPVASAWNDIDAGFSPVAANYMSQGLQEALDKEARSMIEYCEKKMAKSAAIFNRSQ